MRKTHAEPHSRTAINALERSIGETTVALSGTDWTLAIIARVTADVRERIDRHTGGMPFAVLAEILVGIGVEFILAIERMQAEYPGDAEAAKLFEALAGNSMETVLQQFDEFAPFLEEGVFEMMKKREAARGNVAPIVHLTHEERMERLQVELDERAAHREEVLS